MTACILLSQSKKEKEKTLGQVQVSHLLPTQSEVLTGFIHIYPLSTWINT